MDITVRVVNNIPRRQKILTSELIEPTLEGGLDSAEKVHDTFSLLRKEKAIPRLGSTAMTCGLSLGAVRTCSYVIGYKSGTFLQCMLLSSLVWVFIDMEGAGAMGYAPGM